MAMNRGEWLTLLQKYRVLGVIRAPHLETGVNMATAAAAGGIRLIEITWNSTAPVQMVSHLRERLSHCWVGVGTILTLTDLETAAAAGAQFAFSPHVDVGLLHRAEELGIPFVAGALTPTEIVAAWTAGAAGVKVFPVSTMGGAEYIRSLQGPLGQIPLIPTGGVTEENALAMISAGAIAVGLSSSLFPQAAVTTANWTAIAERAEHVLQALKGCLDTLD